MKLSKVVTSYSALAELAQTKLPGKASYNVAKNIKKLEPDFQFFQDKRKAILTEMYTHIPGQQDIFVPNDKDQGPKALQELLDIETDVDESTLHHIAPSDIGAIEVTPAVLLELDWMIQEVPSAVPTT